MKSNRPWIKFAALGFELSAAIVGGVLLGQALDQHFEVKGYWTAGLVVAAFSAWVVRLVKGLK